MVDSKFPGPVDAAPDTAALDRNLRSVARWQHGRFVSRRSLEALKEVEANAVENRKLVRMSIDNTATAVALAAINVEGIKRMTAVKTKLATNVAAGRQSFDTMAASHAAGSSGVHRQLVADLERRHAAGEIDDEDFVFNLDRLQQAHARRRAAAYDRAEEMAQEIEQLADEAQRSRIGRN